MKLNDRVVLITGAGRGIGRATAIAFARAGARVALQGKTKKNLVEVQKELKALDAAAIVLPGDVSDEGTVARSVAAAEQQLGPIDVLVNNAGIFAFVEVDACDTAVFDRILAVNLRGPFLMSRAVLPGMKARRSGHILNIVSTAGKRGFAGGGPYCASKFGLLGLSEAMLYEARTHDVGVTCVLPSTVETDMVKRSGFEYKPDKVLQPADVAEAIVSLVATESRVLPTQIELWQTNP